MPLYEYQCESCGVRFEVIQKFTDEPRDACKACGGKVRRLLSAPAIQFKGTGWYITDYARKGKSDGDASSPSSTSSSTDTASSTASSDKPSTGTNSSSAAGTASSASTSSTSSEKK
jgi:putative FmdB family regulatory protein